MKPVTLETQEYFSCLSCGKHDFRVDHLFGETYKTAGTWYCDVCGEGHKVQVNRRDVLAELTGTQRFFTSTLLKLRPDVGDVWLTIRSRYFSNHHGGKPAPEEPWFDSSNRYFYEEGTCPVNYLKDVIEILQVAPDGEACTDPHGIFEYVMSAPVYTDENGTDDDVAGRLAMFGLPTEAETK